MMVRTLGIFLHLSLALCQIDIQLLANWEKPPFELRLLETISSENESYYLSALSKVAGFQIDEAEEPLGSYTDESLYEAVFEDLTSTERSLFDIALANKYYSPRIISHYKFYNDTVLPKFESKLLKKCGSTPKTWLQFNDVVYCHPDDVYALMTDSTSDEPILPFDRVIGSSGPLLFLYGDVRDPQFGPFVSNLYDAASAGKLRFVWRYVPQNTEERELLSGYGVDLTLKRTDYIVIDDRDGKKDFTQSLSHDVEGSDSIIEIYDDDIKSVKKEDLAQLDLQAASYALSLADPGTQLATLLKLVEELPKFSSYLVDQDVNEGLVAQIAFNQRLGISSESTGIYLNGRPLTDSKSDIFGLYNELKEELGLVKKMERLGVDSVSARHLIGKFALMSLYKARQIKSTRYALPQDSSDPVIFLNDVESDAVYADFTEDLSVYVARHGFGQIPPVKANLHTLIFIIDLADRNSVAVVNGVLKSVASNGIAQQIGVIPLALSEEGTQLANELYHIHKSEGTEKVLKFLTNLEVSKKQPVLHATQDYVTKLVYPFVESFDVGAPSVIVNGVFYPLDDNWPYSLARQVSEDVNLIMGIAYQKMAETAAEVKTMIYDDALPFRNALLFPTDRSTIAYRAIDIAELEKLRHLAQVVEFDSLNGGENLATLTLAGNFASEVLLKQLRELLILAKSTEISLKVRLVHTSDGVSFLGKIKQACHTSIDHAVSVVDDIIAQGMFDESESSAAAVTDFFSSIGIHALPVMIFNGRLIELGSKHMSASHLDHFILQEIDQRVGVIQSLLGPKFKEMEGARHDWFESLSSIITTSFYGGSSAVGGVSRFDFSRVNTDLSISFGDESQSKVHMLAVVDPAEERSQKILSLVSAVKDIDMLSIDVILVPKTELQEMPVKRFYKGNFKAHPTFKDGMEFEEPFVKFEKVPEKTLFTLDMDVPSSWIVTPKKSVSDLDNVILSQTGPVQGIYELRNIIIEGNAFDAVTHEPPTGLAVQVPGSDTYVMTNLGYLQLKANPGLWEFSIKEGRSSELYNLLSVDSPHSKSETPVRSATLAIMNLDGLHVFPRVTKKPGKESESLIVSDEKSVPLEGDKKETQGVLSSWFQKTKKKTQADINIFTVASGHLYERLLSIMTASVMQHTKHTVKFWLIDNYMSPTFREFLPHLAEKYGFEYELINYKWPSWLRGQREKQRTIWGYKILFLDVLFPQDLDKVIFVDSDQIVRADMMELVEMDLDGAPYGYTPMGDSRKEMEGFRFWKQGYWKTFLGDKLKYHISALYVIDLKKFRSIAAGDRLRGHYQALSRDPNSLSNLDQDLPNNLQPQLKIFSLPQEWLWCETWCDDESLKTAKTIDLCNNPLTKEPKLDRARRQIPEWSVYDDEITALRDEVLGHHEDNDAGSIEASVVGTAVAVEDESPAHDEL